MGEFSSVQFANLRNPFQLFWVDLSHLAESNTHGTQVKCYVKNESDCFLKSGICSNSLNATLTYYAVSGLDLPGCTDECDDLANVTTCPSSGPAIVGVTHKQSRPNLFKNHFKPAPLISTTNMVIPRTKFESHKSGGFEKHPVAKFVKKLPASANVQDLLPTATNTPGMTNITQELSEAIAIEVSVTADLVVSNNISAIRPLT
ncbi:hypothetical protein HDU76_004275 [Blyttiomyces sp. JEL0837]|nr:hypothetical protein HDU76_004275 [Blyttiomyces sp. JEL0837]